MYCSPPGSSVHGILQARMLEWVAISSSGGIFLTQGLILLLLHGRRLLYCLNPPREAHHTKTIKILSWSFPHKVSVHFIPNPRGKEQSLSATSPPHGPASSPQAENKGLSSHGSPLSHHFWPLRISLLWSLNYVLNNTPRIWYLGSLAVT